MAGGLGAARWHLPVIFHSPEPAYLGLTEADGAHFSRCKSRLQNKSAVEPDFRIRHPNFYPFVLFIGAVYSKVAPSVVLRLNSWGGAPGAPGDASPQPEWTEGLSQLLILEQPASTHQHPSLPKRGQSWGEGAKLGSETHISYQVASQSEHIPGDLILPSALVSS